MFKYYPAFISKAGELEALKKIVPDKKEQISPVLELVNKGASPKSIVSTLKEHYFFDGNQILIDYAEKSEDAASLIDALRAHGIYAVPVVNLSMNKRQLEIADKYIERRKSKMAIRLSEKNGSLYGMTFKRLEDFVLERRSNPNNTIIIVDYGFVTDESKSETLDKARKVLNELYRENYWNDIVFLGGSFPKFLSALDPRSQSYYLRRHELDVYKSLKEKYKQLIYGDYGTKHPYYVPIEKIEASCSIKYTHEENFVIFRGKKASASIDGYKQYITHSKNLVGQSDYYGQDFSWGDSQIMEVSRQDFASLRPKTKSNMNWVSISQNHHIVQTLRMLD